MIAAGLTRLNKTRKSTAGSAGRGPGWSGRVVVLIGGSTLLTFYGLHKLGGWGELKSTCGSDMFNLWKPLIPEGVSSTWQPVMEKNSAGELTRMAWYFNNQFPWLGMAICAPVIGLWYWCADQYIVQRALLHL